MHQNSSVNANSCSNIFNCNLCILANFLLHCNIDVDKMSCVTAYLYFLAYVLKKQFGIQSTKNNNSQGMFFLESLESLWHFLSNSEVNLMQRLFLYVNEVS